MDGIGGAAVFAARFTEPEDMAAALRAAKVDYVSLMRRRAEAPYGASLAMVDLGGLTIQHADDGAHIATGVTDTDHHMMLFLPAGKAEGLTMNAHMAASHDAVILGPGTELRAVCRQPVQWAGIAVRGLPRLSEHAVLPHEGRFTVLPGVTARLPMLAHVANEIGACARHDPGRFAHPAVRAALAEQVLGVMTHALGRHGGDTVRALHRRVRLVAQAEARLAASPGLPVYTEELAAEVGVSARTLHEGFRAVSGMSVQRYLRIRRLSLARSALRRGELVKRAALAHGFWHLGRFASDYRSVFGELPSETLALRPAAR